MMMRVGAVDLNLTISCSKAADRLRGATEKLVVDEQNPKLGCEFPAQTTADQAPQLTPGARSARILTWLFSVTSFICGAPAFPWQHSRFES
jgi:hypothetical protein